LMYEPVVLSTNGNGRRGVKLAISYLFNISCGYIVNNMSMANEKGISPYPLLFSQRI